MLNAAPPGPAHMGPHHPTHMGPPHFVELHINPGAHLTFQLTDGNETILSGPASITMISEYTFPPVPVPVQVPPGHTVHQIVDEHGTLKHIILSLDETTNPDGAIQPAPSLSQLGLTGPNFPSAAPLSCHDSHSRPHQHPHHHHHQHHHHHHQHQQHEHHHQQNQQPSNQRDDRAVVDAISDDGDTISKNADNQGTIEPVKHVTNMPAMDNSLLSNDENAIGSNPSFLSSHDGCSVVTDDDAAGSAIAATVSTKTMTENVSSAFNSSTKNSPSCNHLNYDKPNESDPGSPTPHIIDKESVKTLDLLEAIVKEDISENSPTIAVTKLASKTVSDNSTVIVRNSDAIQAKTINSEADEDSINDKHSTNEPFSINRTTLSKEIKDKHLILENDMICSNDNMNKIKEYIDNDKDNISDNNENGTTSKSYEQARTSTSEKQTEESVNTIVATNADLTLPTVTTTSDTTTIAAIAPTTTTLTSTTTTTTTTVTTTSANTTASATTADSFNMVGEDYQPGAIISNEILGQPADSFLAAPTFTTVLPVPMTSHHSVPPSYATYASCCCCCYCSQPGGVTGLPIGPVPLNHSSTSPSSLRVPSACMSGVGGIASSATGPAGNGIIAFPNGPITGPGPPPPLLGPNGVQAMQTQTSVGSMHHQHVPIHHHQVQITASGANNSSNIISTTSTVANRSRVRGTNTKQQTQRNTSNNNNNNISNTQQSHNNHQQHHSHIHNNSQLSHHSTTGHSSEKQQQTNSNSYNSGYINSNNNNSNNNIVSSTSKRTPYQHGSNGGTNATTNNHNLMIHKQNISYHNTGLNGMNNNVLSSSNYSTQHNSIQHNHNHHQQAVPMQGFSKSSLQQVSQHRSSNVKNVLNSINSNNLMIAPAHHHRTTSASPTHSKSSTHNNHHHAHVHHINNNYDRLGPSNDSNAHHHHNHHHSSQVGQQQQVAPTQASIDLNHYHHVSSEHQTASGFVNEDSSQHTNMQGVGQGGGGGGGVGETSQANLSTSYKLSYKHDLHQNHRQSSSNGNQSVNSNNSKSFHNVHNSQNVTIFSSHIHQSNNKSASYHIHDNHPVSEYSHNGQPNNGQIVGILSHNNASKQHHVSTARQSFEPHYGGGDLNQNHLSSSPWHHNHATRLHNQQSNHNNRTMKQSATNELNGHHQNQDNNIYATNHNPYSNNNSYREIKTNKECHKTSGLANNNNNNQLSSAASNSSFSSSTSSRHNYHSGYNPSTSSGVNHLNDHEQEFQAQNKTAKNSVYHQNSIRSNGITIPNIQASLASTGRSQQIPATTKTRNQLTGPISIKQRPQSAGGKSVINNNNYQQVGQRHQVPPAPLTVNNSRSVVQPNAINVTIFNNKSAKHHQRVQSQSTNDNRNLKLVDDFNELKGVDDPLERDKIQKLVRNSMAKKNDDYQNDADIKDDDHDDNEHEQKQQRSANNENHIIMSRSHSSSSVRTSKLFHQDESSDRHGDDESSTGCISPMGVETTKATTLKKNSTANASTSTGPITNRNTKKQIVKDKATSPGNTRQTNSPDRKSCSTSTDDHIVTSSRSKHMTTVTNYTQTNALDEQITNVKLVTSEHDSDQINLSFESSPSTNSTGDSVSSSRQNRANKRACARNQQNPFSTSSKNVSTQHNASTDDDLQLIVTIDKDAKSGNEISLEMIKVDSKSSDGVSYSDTNGDHLQTSPKNKTNNKLIRASLNKSAKVLLGDNDLSSGSIQEQFSDDEDADSDSIYCTPNKVPIDRQQQHIADGELTISSKSLKDKNIGLDTSQRVTSFDEYSFSAKNTKNSDNNQEAKEQIDKNSKSPKKNMSTTKKHPHGISADQLLNSRQMKHTSPASTPERFVASVRLNNEESSNSLSDANLSDATSELIDDHKSSLASDDQIESRPLSESTDSTNTRNSARINQDIQRSSQQHSTKKNNPPNRVATKSLIQLKILNLHCTSITSTSVQLRWSYLQPIAERFGCINTQSRLFSEHFVVEMGTRKTSDGQSIASSKVIYQGNGTTFKASHLNGQNLYHFRVRRSTTLSIPADTNLDSIASLNGINSNTIINNRDSSTTKSDNNKQQAFKECLVVSEIMSVTLPSHHSKQRGNKSSAIANNYCDSQSTGDNNQAECYNGQLGSSPPALSLSTGVISSAAICGKSSSSQRSSRNKSSFSLTSYVRSAFLGIDRTIRGSITNYSDRKAAVLICILFILSAMILAIFVQYLLL